MTHALKTWPEYFGALMDGSKTFEVRCNDRAFRLGDKLLLREWDPTTEAYTGREIDRTIGYILRDTNCGVAPGFVVMGFVDPDGPEVNTELTEQQLQIIALTSEGLTIREIAVRLQLHPSSVGHERERIFTALDAKSMYQAVAMAVRNGWI